jgi:chromosome segregation ATPase
MDGTTATTLAPSEDEMNKIAETFAKMRDFVIDTSRLAGEVAELRREVEATADELQILRGTNRWMDAQITELREARDEAISEKHASEDAAFQARQEVERLTAYSERQREELGRLNKKLVETDNDLLTEMSHSEGLVTELRALKAKLAAIQAVFAVTEQPRAEDGKFQPKPADWSNERQAPQATNEAHNEPHPVQVDVPKLPEYDWNPDRFDKTGSGW